MAHTAKGRSRLPFGHVVVISVKGMPHNGSSLISVNSNPAPSCRCRKSDLTP